MVDGWLVVDYDGPELTVVEIGYSTIGQPEWRPAFLDWLDGKRVAKIRPPVTGVVYVWLRARGRTRRAGKVAL